MSRRRPDLTAAAGLGPFVRWQRGRRRARADLLDLLPHPTLDDPFSTALCRPLSAFQANGEPVELLPILGVGAGRTPAGDDILLGVLAGTDLVAGRTAQIRRARLCRALQPRLAAGTTRLSTALLAGAIARRYPAPIAALLAVATEPSARAQDVATAAARVASFGQSSGRAFLLGVRSALLAPH